MRVLIAEDDFTSRSILTAILAKWGYEVVSAADGDEAWAALQKPDAPRIALLDWMMPGMTGPELCRRVRGRERAGPLYIILVTSKGERQDIVRGLDAGADDYIAKPYDKEELRARINVGRRILDLQSALAQQEKLQGVLEMAGAVCHELNQPLQVVSGYSNLLLMDLSESDPKYATLKTIKEGIDRMGALTRKIMNVTKYKTRDYMGGKSKIVDIDQSSGKEEALEDTLENGMGHRA
jgi:CheY-like chemotaxis protein